MFLLLAALLVAAGAACYTDITQRKIPNVLVAVLLLCALALHARGGIQDVATSAGLFVIVLAAGLVPFALRVMGGGDVKFLAAGAAMLGLPAAFSFLCYTFAAGAFLAIGYCLIRKRLPLLSKNLYGYLCNLSTGAALTKPATSAGNVPYAIAIFAGALATTLTTVHS